MTRERGTILVVEDEPIIRMNLVLLLEDQGFAVLEAGNVLEAIALIGRFQIDGLVTDIDMPGALNGLDLAAMVAKLDARVARIVVSGGTKPAEDALPAGTIFLSKPYSKADILTGLDLLKPRTRAQSASSATA